MSLAVFQWPSRSGSPGEHCAIFSIGFVRTSLPTVLDHKSPTSWPRVPLVVRCTASGCIRCCSCCCSEIDESCPRDTKRFTCLKLKFDYFVPTLFQSLSYNLGSADLGFQLSQYAHCPRQLHPPTKTPTTPVKFTRRSF